MAQRPGGRFAVPNTEVAATELLAHLAAEPPTLIVLEVTGGVELPLTGDLATDALDAHVLTHFAEVVRPELRPLPDVQAQELAVLVTRRRQLIEVLTAEKNRWASARGGIRKPLCAHIMWLERAWDQADTDLAEVIRWSSVWREKEELLRSVPQHRPDLGDHTAGKIHKYYY